MSIKTEFEKYCDKCEYMEPTVKGTGPYAEYVEAENKIICKYRGKCSTIAAEIRRTIQQETKDSEWIPTRERNPTETGPYEVTAELINGERITLTTGWSENLGWNMSITANVIAWRPPQKPYGGE